MKSVFGLLVALAGLFIVWLWASGRANAVWQSLVSGNANTGAGSTTAFSPLSVNLSPQAVLAANVQATPDFLQVLQPTNVPSYIPMPNVNNTGFNNALFNVPQGTYTGIGPQP